MNKVLEFVIWYIWYLMLGFIGVWLGSLIIGSDTNVFTSWIPYIWSTVFVMIDYLLVIKDKEI